MNAKKIRRLISLLMTIVMIVPLCVFEMGVSGYAAEPTKTDTGTFTNWYAYMANYVTRANAKSLLSNAGGIGAWNWQLAIQFSSSYNDSTGCFFHVTDNSLAAAGFPAGDWVYQTSTSTWVSLNDWADAQKDKANTGSNMYMEAYDNNKKVRFNGENTYNNNIGTTPVGKLANHQEVVLVSRRNAILENLKIYIDTHNIFNSETGTTVAVGVTGTAKDLKTVPGSSSTNIATTVAGGANDVFCILTSDSDGYFNKVDIYKGGVSIASTTLSGNNRIVPTFNNDMSVFFKKTGASSYSCIINAARVSGSASNTTVNFTCSGDIVGKAVVSCCQPGSYTANITINKVSYRNNDGVSGYVLESAKDSAQFTGYGVVNYSFDSSTSPTAASGFTQPIREIICAGNDASLKAPSTTSYSDSDYDYTWDGWYNGDAKTTSLTVSRNTTYNLTGIWIKTRVFTIAFDPNGGTFGAIAGTYTQSGDNIVYRVAQNQLYSDVFSALPVVTRQNKAFDGWYYHKGQSDEFLLTDANLGNNPTMSGTFVAQWSNAVPRKVTFMPNASSGDTVTHMPGTANGSGGYEITVTTGSCDLSGQNVPVNSDFTDNSLTSFSSSGVMPKSFLGWDTSASATNPAYKYDHSTGSFNNPTLSVGSDVTLYAIWCKHDTWRNNFKSNPFGVNWDNVSGQIYACSRCTVCGAEVQRSHNVAFNARQYYGGAGANILLYTDTLFIPYNETTFYLDTSKYPLPCESGSKTEQRFEGWRIHGRASENAALIAMNSTYPLNSTTTGNYSTNFFASYQEGYYEMLLDAGEFGSIGYGVISRSNFNTTTSPTANHGRPAGSRRYEIIAIYGTGESIYVKGKLDGAAVTSTFPKSDFSESNWVFCYWHSMSITNVTSRAYVAAASAGQEFRLDEISEDYTANPVIINGYVNYNGLTGYDVYCLADYRTYTSVSGVTPHAIRYYANNLGSSTGYNGATFSSYNGPFAGTIQNNGKRVETQIVTISDATNIIGDRSYAYYYFPTVATDPSGETYDNNAYSTPISDQTSANVHTYFYLEDDVSGSGKFKSIKEVESGSRYYWQQEYLQIDRNDNTSSLKAGNYGVAPHPSSNHRFNVYTDGIAGSAFDPRGYGDLSRFYDEPGGVWACYLQWDLGIRYLPYYIDESTEEGRTSAANLAVYNYIETSTTNRNFYFLSADFYTSDGASAIKQKWAKSKLEIVGWYIDTNGNHEYDSADLYFSADEKVSDDGFSCSYDQGTINYAVCWYVNRVANYAASGKPLTMYAVWEPVVELTVSFSEASGAADINALFSGSKISYTDKYGKSHNKVALTDFRYGDTKTAIIKIEPGSEIILTMYSDGLQFVSQNNRYLLNHDTVFDKNKLKIDRVIGNGNKLVFRAATDTNLVCRYGSGGSTYLILDRNNKALKNNTTSSNWDNPFLTLYNSSTGIARIRFGLFSGSGFTKYVLYNKTGSSAPKTCKVTVNDTTKSGIAYDTLYTVYSDASNFKGWTENGKIVSTDRIYTFRVNRDITLSVATSGSASAFVRIADSGSEGGRKYAVSQWFAPEGCTFVESGFIVATSPNATIPDSVDAGSLNNNSGEFVYSFYKVTTTVTEKAGTFKLITKPNYTVRAYFSYRDSSGETQTIFSPSTTLS